MMSSPSFRPENKAGILPRRASIPEAPWSRALDAMTLRIRDSMRVSTCKRRVRTDPLGMMDGAQRPGALSRRSARIGRLNARPIAAVA
jgi:hypothetical protein